MTTEEGYEFVFQHSSKEGDKNEPVKENERW